VKLEILNKENIRQPSVRKKTASRICAVQVLYESSFLLKNIELIINSYFKNYLNSILLELNIKDIDRQLFNSIIEGVNENIIEIDLIITKNIAQNWSFDRLSKTEISVFRLAVFELSFVKNFSKKTIINEYISIFESFGGNANFANGMLENISKNIKCK
jgi:N utilization substance protein B|tara:strand:+ start:12013 stop:12489 length:477 start_codon:yes stop_codon:yes gene_type:complete